MSALLVVPRFVALRAPTSWTADHEGGHVIAAAALDCPVGPAMIHAHGGSTFADGTPREQLLIAVAGDVATRLAGRDVSIVCSRRDVHRAFAIASSIARAEFTTRCGWPKDAARLRALSEFVAVRVHEIVLDAEAEAVEILRANRRALRRIAEALEEHRHLDAAEIAALIETDNRRKQA
jgi:hypothetical protein